MDTLRELDEPILNLRQTRFQHDSQFEEINHPCEVSKLLSNGRCSAPLVEDEKEVKNESYSHSHREDTKGKLEMSHGSFGNNIMKRIEN